MDGIEELIRSAAGEPEPDIGGEGIEGEAGTVYVPERKKTSFVSALSLILAGVFLLIGISALATIMGQIESYIMIFLQSLTGWDPLLSYIFIAAFALFISTLIFVIVKRGSEVARKLEAILKTKITNEPTEYYALELVPHEELIYEFKKRGCIPSESEGGGVEISCPGIPISKRVKGVIDPTNLTLSNVQKGAVGSVIAMLWAFYLGAVAYGSLYGALAWIAALVLLLITCLILLGSSVIKLWHTAVAWTIFNTLFTMFYGADPVLVWSLWGALFAFVILLAVAYLLREGECRTDDKWQCRLM